MIADFPSHYERAGPLPDLPDWGSNGSLTVDLSHNLLTGSVPAWPQRDG